MLRDLTEIIPQEFQTGLPPEIFMQPAHVGGSLGFGTPRAPEDFWDQLEDDADSAELDPIGAPGSGVNLRQVLNSFLFLAQPLSNVVVPFNKNRTYLMLQNKGTSSVFVAFGHTASVNDFTILPGAGFYEPILGTVSSVHIVSESGSQRVTVIEGVRY